MWLKGYLSYVKIVVMLIYSLLCIQCNANSSPFIQFVNSSQQLLEVAWPKHFKLLCHYLFRSFHFLLTNDKATRDLKQRACQFVSYSHFTDLIPIIDCGVAQCWSIFWFKIFFIMSMKAEKDMMSMDGNVQHVSSDDSAILKF